MRFGSVCSGIEAASQAWLPMGWQCQFTSEIEAFPRAVLKHHYPDVPLHGDFTTIKAGDYAAINVLVGGTPCQSFSVAGLRGGMEDERGNLALEYLRLADRLKPEWIVWENVPGVLSSNGGRDFGAFLGGLGQLGYGFAYRVLDAQYFGLAQRRKRVFVVGCLGDWRRAAAVLLEPASLRGNPPPRRESRKDLAPTISARPTGGGGLGTDFDLDGGLVAFGGNNTSGPIDVSTALNAHGGPMGRMDFESETFVAHTLRGEGFDASEDGSGRGTPIVPVCFDTTQVTSSTNRSNPRPGDPCHTLNGAAHPPAIAFSCKDHGADAGSISPTLRAMGHSGSHANAGGQVAVSTTQAVRRLTPRECERLQGFPDDFTLIPWRKGIAPDGPRYKALGNSMAVPVMEWIGRRIAAQHALKVAA